MQFKCLDHIAFRVADIEPVVKFYIQTLGFEIVQKIEMDFVDTKAQSSVLQLPGNPFYILVDQGLDWNNPITRWVKKYGGGLHHTAYLVEDIEQAATELMKKGMQFTTEKVVDTGGGIKQFFSTPNPMTGILTEIIQRDRDNVFFVKENIIELIRSTEGI